MYVELLSAPVWKKKLLAAAFQLTYAAVGVKLLFPVAVSGTFLLFSQ